MKSEGRNDKDSRRLQKRQLTQLGTVSIREGEGKGNMSKEPRRTLRAESTSKCIKPVAGGCKAWLEREGGEFRNRCRAAAMAEIRKKKRRGGGQIQVRQIKNEQLRQRDNARHLRKVDRNCDDLPSTKAKPLSEGKETKKTASPDWA